MKEGTKYLKKGKYGNITSQQNLYFFDKLKEILQIIKPDRIIEIGTARGATTLLMSDILNELNFTNSRIKSFDIIQRDHLKNINRDNIEFYVGNIFNYNKKILTEPEEITNFLSENGVNLILCDGGLKTAEFQILSEYLKNGDIIMAHDYAPNREIFMKEYVDKIWNHMEITDKDIENTVKKYNLKPYRMDIIKETAWVAKIKE